MCIDGSSFFFLISIAKMTEIVPITFSSDDEDVSIVSITAGERRKMSYSFLFTQ